MTILDAIAKVTEGHAGQVDKAGEPYVSHVIRVAASVPDEYARVALFHDYFEDVVQKDDLEVMDIWKEIPELTLEEAVSLFYLTRQKGVNYEDYIRMLSNFEIAKVVKIADLKDHLRDTSVIPLSLIERYRKALSMLEAEDGS